MPGRGGNMPGGGMPGLGKPPGGGPLGGAPPAAIGSTHFNRTARSHLPGRLWHAMRFGEPIARHVRCSLTADLKSLLV